MFWLISNSNNDQKLLFIMINLNINLHNKKLLVTKIITIINTKL